MHRGDSFRVCTHRNTAKSHFRISGLRVILLPFEKYGLLLHPDKTKLLEFGRNAWGKGRGTGKRPQTFNFLGFTHYCGTSRKGKFAVKVKTMSKKLSRSMKRVADWCRKHRHKPLVDQWRKLCQLVRGHYEYYGRRGNSVALNRFRSHVRRTWKKWLNRRHRGNSISWDRFARIERTYPLPPPRILMIRSRNQLSLFGELV